VPADLQKSAKNDVLHSMLVDPSAGTAWCVCLIKGPVMSRSDPPFRPGGHPPQTDLLTDRAVFTHSYAVIPKGTMRDIVTSALPFWTGTRVWVLARPLSGFAESFSHYLTELAPGGGSDRPDTDPTAQAVL